jgi:hypothetical protein
MAPRADENTAAERNPYEVQVLMRGFFTRFAAAGADAGERWCPSCGKRRDPRANFCVNCGSDLREGKETTPEESQQPRTEEPPRQPVFMGPDLLPLGTLARCEREKHAAPFPRCASTEEILACQDKAREAGLIVISWHQRPLVLRAPRSGENGVVVAESADDRPDKLVRVFSAERAATGTRGSSLWVVNQNYPLLGSLAAVQRYDREHRDAARRRADATTDGGDAGSRRAATFTVPPSPSPQVGTGRTGGGTITVWRLITHHERGEEVAEWSRREGIIAVGFGGTGDLAIRRPLDASDLTRMIGDNHPDSSTSNRVNGGHSLWRLYHELRAGDLVILSAGSSGAGRLLTMRVTGDYFFVGGEYPPYYEHRRKAEVVPIDPDLLWQFSGGAAAGENVRRTLIRCARALSEEQCRELVA